MKEKVYINKETGELYLWTNVNEGEKYLFWFYVTGENDYLIKGTSELECLGEL